MQTYRELIESKPSKALRAMVNGLRRQSQRPDFVINMLSFGHLKYESEGLICFGCAATCAVQELRQVDINPLNFYRFDYYNSDNKDLIDFEYAIDFARKGNFECLFKYCFVDYPYDLAKIIEGEIYLNTHDWEEQLPNVEEIIQKLEEFGF